jgi:hypothetical protein
MAFAAIEVVCQGEVKGSNLLLTHEAFPFDKMVAGIADPKMVEDTARIINEAIKDKLQVNLVEADSGPRLAQSWAFPLNFEIWIKDDGWLRNGAYRINVTFRFKVRRRERFVEKIKKPSLGCKENFTLKIDHSVSVDSYSIFPFLLTGGL